MGRLEDVEGADDVHVEARARAFDAGSDREDGHVEDAVDPLQSRSKLLWIHDVALEDAHPVGGKRLGEVLATRFLVEDRDGLGARGEELVDDV